MQKLMGITVRGKWLILAASTFLILALFSPAGAETAVDKIHFLIPGGAGGGWDGTARGVGKALVDSGIIKRASF